MKKEILSYITSTINQYERAKQDEENCNVMSVINDLTDMYEFVVDIKEENIDVTEVNARYINRIAELEDGNKSAKEKYENLRLGNVTMFNKLTDNDKTMDKYQEEISELYAELRKAPVSATLSLQTELQELKSKLAESEKEITQLRYENEEINKLLGLERTDIVKKQLEEAELTIKNMMDNESRLNKKVEKAELEAKRYSTVCKILAERNNSLKGDN